MHAVCRKYQGLPWTKEEPHGMIANLQHLVDVSVCANPEDPPPDTLMLAYDARAAPKLVKEINADSLPLRQKALKAALRLAAAPKELSSLLTAGFVPALHTAAAEVDVVVRESAALALAVTARQYNGREQMLVHDSIGVLSTLVCDAEKNVRQYGLLAILELSKSPVGAQRVVDAGKMKLLIRRCAEEVVELQGLALMVLQQAMSRADGLTQAVTSNALDTIAPLLDSVDPFCREKAGLCLAAYTVSLSEKVAAGESMSVLASLLRLLSDKALAVRVAATNALMSITIANECKSVAVSLKAVAEISPLLEECVLGELQGGTDAPTRALTLNVLQTMGQLAEHPVGRKQLQGSLTQLETLTQSTAPQVAKHAANTVALIKWMP